MHPKVQGDWDQEESIPSQHQVGGEESYLVLFRQHTGFLQ